jgi:hypothetical protein
MSAGIIEEFDCNLSLFFRGGFIGSDVLCDKEQEDAQGRGVVVTFEGGIKAMCERQNEVLF